jgi:hypothetical protein
MLFYYEYSKICKTNITSSWKINYNDLGYILKMSCFIQHSSFPVRMAPSSDTDFEVRSLVELQHYEFWVTASTIVGEGERSRLVPQAPNSRGRTVIRFRHVRQMIMYELHVVAYL